MVLAFIPAQRRIEGHTAQEPGAARRQTTDPVHAGCGALEHLHRRHPPVDGQRGDRRLRRALRPGHALPPSRGARRRCLAHDRGGGACARLVRRRARPAPGRAAACCSRPRRCAPRGTSMELSPASRRAAPTHLRAFTRLGEHPSECVELKEDGWRYLAPPPPAAAGRQDYRGNFRFINGALYLARTAALLRRAALRRARSHGALRDAARAGRRRRFIAGSGIGRSRARDAPVSDARPSRREEREHFPAEARERPGSRHAENGLRHGGRQRANSRYQYVTAATREAESRERQLPAHVLERHVVEHAQLRDSWCGVAMPRGDK